MKHFLIIIYLLLLSQYSQGQTSEIIYSYTKSKVGAQTKHIFASESDTITICQGTTDKPLPLVLTKDKKINLKEDAKRKAYDFIDEKEGLLAYIDVVSHGKPLLDIVMPDSTRLVAKKYNKKSWSYSLNGQEIMYCNFTKSEAPKLSIMLNVEYSNAIEYAIMSSQCQVLWVFYSAKLYPVPIGIAALRTIIM